MNAWLATTVVLGLVFLLVPMKVDDHIALCFALVIWICLRGVLA